MVRPKADAPGPSARQRIENGFWTMLSEMDYSKITVEELCRRADVNHNTFYYHFQTIDGFAIEAVGQEPARSLAPEIVPMLCDATAESNMRKRFTSQSGFGRAYAAAQNGSRALVREMVESAICIWAEGEGIVPSELTEGERTQLRFGFAGTVAVMGEIPRKELVSAMHSESSRAIGESVSIAFDRVRSAHLHN